MADPFITGANDWFKNYTSESAVAFRAKRKEMRLAQGIVDIEDIPQEEYDALVKRNKELKALREQPFSPLFKEFQSISAPGIADEVTYAVHSGAPELVGGIMDPGFTKGNMDKASTSAMGGGDTKGANKAMARQLRSRVSQASEGFDDQGVKKWKRMLDVVTDPSNKVTATEGFEDGLLISASPAKSGVHTGYFGRAGWGNRWTSDKVITQSAELAEDLNASTGGRGTFYVFRGVKDYTIDTTTMLGADAGETALLGKHKPIAGLSGYSKKLRDPGMMADYLDKKGIAPGAGRGVEDIDLAWTEKILKEDAERVRAGLVSKEEIYGPTLAERNAVTAPEALKVGQRADIATTARTIQPTKKRAMTAGISYSAAMETVEDNLGNVMRRSRGLGGLLGAATEASAAVAGGVSKTGALRNAGMAATILRSRFL
jgi:hypothetical protein